ncbi:MAG: efflux RND transporter periplasmic adaptor subunit [Deltaproteobacteria bacterium]|nr:efflux RND transporter periplasmic adaptor subunit [Deltaproteobacteria bacterium]
MKNKNFITGMIFLLIGLTIGGTLVWLIGSKEPVEKAAEKTERKVLFYRNPMDPEVTSPSPMKDQMGMDYVPVYEDEAAPLDKPGTVRITPERIQKIGVRSEPVERRDIRRAIRTVGRVEPVEEMAHVITTKVPGWIEKLYVSRTDAMVGKGEKLFELYSPELVSAQEEYLLAFENNEKVKDSPFAEAREGGRALLDASRQKLKYLDISGDQIERLKKQEAVSRTLAIRSPATGSVTEKMAVEGQKIEAGEPLFRIIDHSKVWVYGEVYEYEMPYVKIGQKATLTPSYSPSKARTAPVEHIYTHLGSIRYSSEEATAESRTAKVRFSLDNRDHGLKLGMYLNIEIDVIAARSALAVPDSAVIDTGTRKMVIIDRQDGTFEPREIKTGSKGEGVWEVTEGLDEGDMVVTSASFLIDSESNLKAATSSMGTPRAVEPEPAQAPPAEHRH